MCGKLTLLRPFGRNGAPGNDAETSVTLQLAPIFRARVRRNAERRSRGGLKMIAFMCVGTTRWGREHAS